MLVNALRAHLAEFGIVAAQGLRNVGQLIAIVRDDGDKRLPDVAWQVLQVLANQIEQIETAVTALEPTDHRDGHCHDGCGPEGVPLGPRVRRLAGLGAAAEFNRWENPAGRHHQARQPLFASVAHQRGKRQSAAIEGDQSRSVGDRFASAAVVAVALANKTARIAWAVMLREKEYQPRAMAA